MRGRSMKYKTLDDFKLKGKRILLRVDLNSEIDKGKVILNDRFLEHKKTIQTLKRKKAKTVILAHQSRPGKPDFISLRQHAELLKVKFVPDILGKKAIKAITELKPGQTMLLENIRTLKEEFSPNKNNDLVRILSPLFDFYINDAFSISHRNHTSIVSFPKVLKSAIGPVMEKELKALSKIKLKNCLYVLAGAKPEDSIQLLKKANHVLTAGYLGQLALIAKGRNLGAQNKFLKKELKHDKKLKPHLKKLTIPIDLAVKIKGKRKDLDLENFPSKYEIYDIGPKTQKLYIDKIKKAKCIFMKGPVGFCEEKQFCKGTKAIFQAIANSKAFSVLGGGHSTTALKKLKINKSRFGYISLSGGALVRYLAGEKLPGLEALKKRR